jgi:Holliday junction DNA helicase RuvB
MVRTPRGRMVTRTAYLHFGLPRSAPADPVGNLPLDLGEGEDTP